MGEIVARKKRFDTCTPLVAESIEERVPGPFLLLERADPILTFILGGWPVLAPLGRGSSGLSLFCRRRTYGLSCQMSQHFSRHFADPVVRTPVVCEQLLALDGFELQ